MTTTHDDGGPAYPMAEVRDRDGNGITEGHPGMTLLDYMAAQALVGMGTWIPYPNANGDRDLTSEDALQSRARWAYRQAYAMLANQQGCRPMTTNTARTPGPWRADYNDGDYIITALGSNVPYVAATAGDTAEDKANAAFIVRAANSHDPLVSTLEEIIKCDRIDVARALARAALARAQQS
jgi:hypothetical protein